MSRIAETARHTNDKFSWHSGKLISNRLEMAQQDSRHARASTSIVTMMIIENGLGFVKRRQVLGWRGPMYDRKRRETAITVFNGFWVLLVETVPI